MIYFNFLMITNLTLHTKKLAIRESQRYFIPPVSTILLLSFFVMAIAFFGFQKFSSRGIAVNSSSDENVSHNCQIFEEVKKE